MSKSNIKNIRGTQDFYGVTLLQRNYIIDIIRKMFNLHQFEELQTPAMENIDLLTGKYGDEGDKLLYRILNSGDFMHGVDNTKPLIHQIAEKGLRYDLTVPMMRHIANNSGNITFPWKRFQIQPVWRADRPQKGRFREFIQCDVDIVGSDSILNEVELISIIYRVVKELHISDFKLYINHIGIIKDIVAVFGFENKFFQIFSILDKADKVSIEDVLSEVEGAGVSNEVVDFIASLFELRSNYDFRKSFEFIKNLNEKLKIGSDRFEKVEELFSILEGIGIDRSFLVFDPMLARGLSYYTTFVLELKPCDKSIGSVVGGGRYDNMLQNLFKIRLPEGTADSGVGISFGIDRLHAYMLEKNLFPINLVCQENSLIVPLIKEAIPSGLLLMKKLIEKNISTELFSKSFKIRSALDYANKKSISKVYIIGESELKENKILVKNMIDGTQELLSADLF